jgi:hypothetical protein
MNTTKKIFFIFFIFNSFKAIENEEITTFDNAENSPPFIKIISDKALPANSSLTLGTNIIVGDGLHPIRFTKDNQRILYPVEGTYLLGIDSEGVLKTTDAQKIAGAQGQYVSCQSLYDILLTIPQESQGNIILQSDSLTPLVQGTTALGLNHTSSLVSSEATQFIIGDLTKAYISVDNTVASTSPNAIILESKNFTQNIALRSGKNISLEGEKIDLPDAGTILYLGLDDQKEICTLTSMPPSPGEFTTLRVTQSASIGTFSSTTGGAHLLIPYQTGTKSSLTSSTGIVLDSPSIEIGQETGSIELSGAIKLVNQAFPMPSQNSSLLITINSNGVISPLLSSEKYKEDIREYTWEDTKDFISKIKIFRYKNEEKYHIGWIAEEVAEQVQEKNQRKNIFIIYNNQGDIIGVDHISLLNYGYLYLVSKIESLEKSMQELRREKIYTQERLNEERQKNTKMQEKIIEIEERINLLEKKNL